MKTLILFPLAAAAVVLFPLSLPAQEEVGVLKARREILEAEREASLQKMSDLRMKYIRTDRNLKRTHDRIMELHRNLALSLDAKPEIRKMNDRILQLNSELESLNARLNAANTNKTDVPAAPAPKTDAGKGK